MRTLRRIAFGLVIVYLSLLAALAALMQHPTIFGKVMSMTPESVMRVVPFKRLWLVARAGPLRPGDLAPDFQLSTSDKKSRVELSSLRGRKPVVLIFGSYT
jgi:hypothetical protein